MRIGTMKPVVGLIAGTVALASLAVGCGPTQAEKDLAAKMDAAASRAEMAASKAEAAAKSAASAAQRAQAAADKADAIFQKHMQK